ncbi:MAG: glycoside hydrolase family 140 protein [Phycisphaeraceae bacterium]|nr:glycoside hydrolase family 140 protein [Phycisphaeraceae bacterium]
MALFRRRHMAAPAPAWPLKIGPTRRYLVDQNENPLLIQGDAAWSLIAALTPPEVECYLERRRAQGFNTLIVNLLEHMFAPHAPLNYAGEGPFVDQPFGKPNEKYFQHADWVLRKAGEFGMQVLLASCYLGYPKYPREGWCQEVDAAGAERLREYGRYVARRYRSFDNLVWVVGADRNPQGVQFEAMRALGSATRQHDPRHLISAAVGSESTAADVYPQDVTMPGKPGGWIDIQLVYTYAIVHCALGAEYGREPVMPFVLFESAYEGEHNASQVQIRRQAYWAILCGGCGQFMGNKPMWMFAAGWRDVLDSAAATQMRNWRAVFLSRPWHRLVPDFGHQIVTSGLGEFRGLDYLAAASTDDGATLMAYMPSGRPIIVDTTKLSGSSFRGWWFSPRTGEVTNGGEWAGSDMLTLQPPDREDWVLVLDDAAKNRPAPGNPPPPGGLPAP